MEKENYNQANQQGKKHVASLLDNVLVQTNIGRRLQNIEKFLFDDVLQQIKNCGDEYWILATEYDDQDDKKVLLDNDVRYVPENNYSKPLTHDDLRYKQYYVYYNLKGSTLQQVKVLNFLGYYASLYYEALAGGNDVLVTDYRPG